MSQFLLHESASGYSLFEVTNADELAGEAVQQNVADIQRFGKAVKLSAFKPFTSAANALEQINAVSESQVSSGGGAMPCICLRGRWCSCLWPVGISIPSRPRWGRAGHIPAGAKLPPFGAAMCCCLPIPPPRCPLNRSLRI